MKPLEKLLQAARFASQKHNGQFRKGAAQHPYINHPIEVADLMATVGEVDDVDVLAAALLHDTVEDCGVKPEEIRDLFGEAVAKYVIEVTDDKTLPKPRRKELQIEHAPHLSPGAKTIKLADKISNFRDILDFPPDWEMDRRHKYIEWGEKVVAGLRGANGKLEERFDEMAARARRELGMQTARSAS